MNLRGLLFRLCYGLLHLALGLLTLSRWYLALAGYHILLALAQAAVLLWGRGRAVLRITGVLLLVLACSLAGVNYVGLQEGIAPVRATIPMITVAAYTFGMLGLTVWRAVRDRKDQSPAGAAARAISWGQGAASLLTLQRSMLVSFGAVPEEALLRMNSLTGAGVFIIFTLLGAALIKKGGRNNGNIQDRQGP